LNGPVPTGFGLVKCSTSLTLDQMRFGTMKTFGRVEMNVESTCLKLIATLFLPAALTDAMLLFWPTRLMWSMNLSWRPAVRL
jgi:hypothetical protein